jgi:hypothetical protein
LCLLPTPALAYVDPASGGAIASAVIGAIVATGIALKTRWYQLKRGVRRMFKGKDE